MQSTVETGEMNVSTRALLLFACFCAVALPPQVHAFEDELLDRFVGDWIMRGTIGGKRITHDVHAEWILAHHYIRFSDIARELDDSGEPAYEALVLIGRDDPTGRYACLWLDVTGGGGLTNGVIGYAEPRQDGIPFVFDTGDGSAIHNTFTYERAEDRWHWVIDIERQGERSNFAKVTLTRGG
jgi:hypothetical protein